LREPPEEAGVGLAGIFDPYTHRLFVYRSGGVPGVSGSRAHHRPRASAGQHPEPLAVNRDQPVEQVSWRASTL
jgi:hypothetical protein